MVAYFHNWTPEGDGTGGDFAYWSDASVTPRSVLPEPRGGNAIDGSKTVHAANIYSRSGRRPPPLQKSASNTLVYLGDEAWELRADGVAVGAPYATDDLRLSLVFRARCFEDAATVDKFNAQLRDPEKQLDLDGILETLNVHAGAKPGAAKTAPRLDTAMRILKLVKYPKPDVIVPWNLCALDRVVPSLEPVIRFLCTDPE